jgi:hypothetical protein
MKLMISQNQLKFYLLFLGLCGFKGGLYFLTLGGDTRLRLSKSPSSVFGFVPGLIAVILMTILY